MPSTYAHYRMGQQVRFNLKGKQRSIVERYPELYLIGLHGPDILFNYRPLVKNAVNREGYRLHERPGREFFEHAGNVIAQQENKAPYLAYTYGVLNHFALDVSCHGYVEQKVSISGVTHAEIEVEFDRRLMLLDRKDPLRQKLARHIVPNAFHAAVIAAFYPEISADAILHALKSMKWFCNRLLVAPNPVKRGAIYVVLKLAGTYDAMHGQIVNYHANPMCMDSNRELRRRYIKGRERAAEFMTDFDRYMQDGTKLPGIFDYNFESIGPEGEIML